MKIIKLISLVVVCVFLAATIPARAQDQNQNQHKKEAKKPAHRAHAKPAQRGRQAKPAQRTTRAQTQQRGRQQARSAPRARQAGTARYTRAGGYRGRIPAARFQANFGRAHTFRVTRFIMVGGHRRFMYGGYYFQLAAPWPMGWGYTSPFYIDWIDGGYWLFNPMYPGVRVAIIIAP